MGFLSRGAWGHPLGLADRRIERVLALTCFAVTLTVLGRWPWDRFLHWHGPPAPLRTLEFWMLRISLAALAFSLLWLVLCGLRMRVSGAPRATIHPRRVSPSQVSAALDLLQRCTRRAIKDGTLWGARARQAIERVEGLRHDFVRTGTPDLDTKLTGLARLHALVVLAVFLVAALHNRLDQALFVGLAVSVITYPFLLMGVGGLIVVRRLVRVFSRTVPNPSAKPELVEWVFAALLLLGAACAWAFGVDRRKVVLDAPLILEGARIIFSRLGVISLGVLLVSCVSDRAAPRVSPAVQRRLRFPAIAVVLAVVSGSATVALTAGPGDLVSLTLFSALASGWVAVNLCLLWLGVRALSGAPSGPPSSLSRFLSSGVPDLTELAGSIACVLRAAGAVEPGQLSVAPDSDGALSVSDAVGGLAIDGRAADHVR